MELVDAYNFMRKIINNGIEKKYSTKNIKKGVNDYINVLKEQECLNKDDYLLLASVANRIDDLIGDKVRVDVFLTSFFGELDSLRKNETLKNIMRPRVSERNN